MRTRIEEGIEGLASRQHGLVTRRQLLELGLTSRMVEHRLAAKRLLPVHRGVYLATPTEPARAREMAATMACGAGAAVSHQSAAWLLDLGHRPAAGSPVHLRVPEVVRIRRPGITVHRSARLEPDDVATVAGIPVTAVGRTLTDLAAVLDRRELERALARAQRLSLITDDALRVRVALHRGEPGIATLAMLLGQEGGAAFTRSELENRFADECRRLGLPAPRHNIVILGYELDCYWPEAQLAVELDGAAYHSSWQSQVNDRRRDRELSAAGIQVIRITWHELVHDTAPTMMRVGQALAIGRDRLSRGAAG